MDNEVHFVVLTSIKFGTGVELHPASLFMSTSAKYVPATLDLMKVTSVEEYEGLTPLLVQRERFRLL